MTWTAPAVARIDEPFHGDERVMLLGFLDYNRASLLLACRDLDGEQLARRACAPSNLSLLGLVRHLADVERNWLRRRFGREELEPCYSTPGDPDAAFERADPARAEQDWATLLAEQQAAREAVAALPLDAEYRSERHGPMSLRWVLIHMTAEYAAHGGHADLLRERIDGRTRG
jgi:uncharacterized damage-inducible protein DinB